MFTLTEYKEFHRNGGWKYLEGGRNPATVYVELDVPLERRDDGANDKPQPSFHNADFTYLTRLLKKPPDRANLASREPGRTRVTALHGSFKAFLRSDGYCATAATRPSDSYDNDRAAARRLRPNANISAPFTTAANEGNYIVVTGSAHLSCSCILLYITSPSGLRS